MGMQLELEDGTNEPVRDASHLTSMLAGLSPSENSFSLSYSRKQMIGREN